MWNEFFTITVPAVVGSGVTFSGLLLASRLNNRKMDREIDAAQDSVWLDIVNQSRVEYALQRKENNRLRYIINHLQEEISTLEKKNLSLLSEIADLKYGSQE